MNPAQYLAHYRANYPDWFTDDGADFPDAEDLWFGDAADRAGTILAGQMVEATKDASWATKGDQLAALITECRAHYEPMNLDWLARATPEDSRWRQPLVVRDKPARDPAAHDYGQYAGMAKAFRDKVWFTFFAKPRVSEKARQNQDARRDRDERPYIYARPLAPNKDRRVSKFGTLDGEIANFRSRPVGNWAFGPAYSLAARWWSNEFGEPFEPNFEACLVEAAQPGEKTYRNSEDRIPGELEPWIFDVNERALNDAAWFWVYLCGRIDLLLDVEQISPDPEYWRRIITQRGLSHVQGRSLDCLERNRILRMIGLIARSHRPDPE